MGGGNRSGPVEVAATLTAKGQARLDRAASLTTVAPKAATPTKAKPAKRASKPRKVVAVALAMALCGVRLLRGPSLPDRILALDTLAINAVALVVLLGVTEELAGTRRSARA